jgi:hypothetical protein
MGTPEGPDFSRMPRTPPSVARVHFTSDLIQWFTESTRGTNVMYVVFDLPAGPVPSATVSVRAANDPQARVRDRTVTTH